MEKKNVTDRQNEVLRLAQRQVGNDPSAIINYLCRLVVTLGDKVSLGFVRAPSHEGKFVHKKPPDPLSK